MTTSNLTSMYRSNPSSNRKQFSSFILFISVVIAVNLFPFHSDFESPQNSVVDVLDGKLSSPLTDSLQLPASFSTGNGNILNRLETCIKFMRLMFTNPVRLSRRTTRCMQAEAASRGARGRKFMKRRPQASHYSHQPQYQQQSSMYHQSAARNQIINHYKPSPPTFIDHADGLYGTYNNAYGRQDGGYHLW